MFDENDDVSQERVEREKRVKEKEREGEKRERRMKKDALKIMDENLDPFW